MTFLLSIYFDRKGAGVHFRVERRNGRRYRQKKGKRDEERRQKKR